MENGKGKEPSRVGRVVGIALPLVLLVLCVIGCVRCVKCVAGDVVEVAVYNDPDSGRSVVFTREDSFFDELAHFPFGPCHTRLTLRDEQGKKTDSLRFRLYTDGGHADPVYVKDVAWDDTGVTVTVWDEQGKHEYRLENQP